MRHLLDFQDVNKNHLENLIDKTRSLEVKLENFGSLALLKFDEPSTRTKVSFSTASNNLGLYQIDLTKENTSSIKGESLKDEITTLIDLDVDILVLRTSSDDKKIYDDFNEIGIILSLIHI